MAFGAYFDTTALSQSGRSVRVLIERDGYSGTTYSPNLQSWDVQSGGSGNSPLQPIVETQATVGLDLETEAQRDAAEALTSASPREFRLVLQADGSDIYQGYVKSHNTDAPLRSGNFGAAAPSISVRASDQLGRLDAPIDQGATAYGGDQDLSVLLANILGTLGYGYSIEAIMSWRPSTTPNANPLAVQVPSTAWERQDSRGNDLVMSRRMVLEDIVGAFACQLRQGEGVWRMVQPGYMRDNSSPTVYTYDSAGAFVSSTSESSQNDLTPTDWEEGTGRLSARENYREARVTYEHGAPDFVNINGSFDRPPDNAGDTTAELWTYSGDAGEAELTDPAFEGTLSQLLIGSQAPSTDSLDDMETRAGNYVFVDIGVLTQGAEDFTLTKHAQTRLLESGGGAGIPDSPDEIRVYWQLKGVEFGTGDVYWFTRNGWKLQSNTSFNERRLDLTQEDFRPLTEWREVVTEIPAPPITINAELQLYEPVGRRTSSSADNFEVRALWDDIRFERASEGTSKFTAVAETTEESGQVFEQTLRIGDGPFKGAEGALKDANGDLTGSWSSQEPDPEGLTALLALTAIRRLGRSRKSVRLTTRRPTRLITRPERTKVLQWKGGLYWPVRISYREANDQYQVVAVEVADVTPPSTVTILAGDVDEEGTGTVATSSTSTSTSTTQDVEEPVYEFGSFFRGAPGAGNVMFRHIAQYAYEITQIEGDSVTQSDVNLSFSLSAGSDSVSFNWGSSTSSITYDVSVPVAAGEIITIVSNDDADTLSTIEDISFSIKLIR